MEKYAAYDPFTTTPDYNTYSDEALGTRDTAMQRKLLKLKLQAYDANQAELNKQMALANGGIGTQGILLNGRRMQDTAGHNFLNDEELAAQQLANDPNAQLQLLATGAAKVQGRTQASILPSVQSQAREKLAYTTELLRLLQQQQGQEGDY